jgi:forespore regulator of the sigma-K checkpoint
MKKQSGGIPVFGFRSMKDIKKKLKRRRKPLLTLGMLAIVFIGATTTGIGAAWLVREAIFGTTVPVVAGSTDSITGPANLDEPAAAGHYVQNSHEAVLDALSRWQGDVEVTLHRVYWCGEETRLLGRHSAASALQLLKSHRDWAAVFDGEGKLMFTAMVDDLSPACRQAAYIGLDAAGNLSVFDGPPRKNNVIRTFFQLDVRSLETRGDMLQQLLDGIPVAGRQDYRSIIASYRPFAKQAAGN